ncbi:hypothetical protein ACEUZ9_001084 [Paracoccus litorisediminis]|uniref:hypothetical protein n=1 Tax=Paracoccus litorisediminis TaxID=2006130 RepID=UPI00372EC9A4
MIDAVSRHFEECISRALDVVKVKDQICGIASHLARLARCPEEQVLEIAAREAPEEIFKVRDLPWVETRSGNMMTAGGHGFPWPFIYLINRCEGGWEYDRNARGALDMEPGAAPVEPDRHRCSELQAAKDLVQSDFEIRINGLVRINLAQELLRDLLASAPTGVDGIAMCLQSYKTGTKRAISDGEAPGP